MPRTNDPECRGLLLRETDSAMLIKPTAGRLQIEHWIPRSQIGYCRKTTLASGAVEIVFTVPEWLLEKKQAWDLVP